MEIKILGTGCNKCDDLYDNVVEALDFTQAETIDVNSGVESEPGIKDVDKLRKSEPMTKACAATTP